MQLEQKPFCKLPKSVNHTSATYKGSSISNTIILFDNQEDNRRLGLAENFKHQKHIDPKSYSVNLRRGISPRISNSFTQSLSASDTKGIKLMNASNGALTPAKPGGIFDKDRMSNCQYKR